MRWIFIVLAGFLEVGWAYSLKSTEGFTRLLPLIPYAVCGLGAAFCLSRAMRTIPVGVTYAMWTGIAVVGSNLIGTVIERQPLGLSRMFFIALILCGVIGLQICYQRS
ncbi:MAG: multidrug efflux SMR transporter [Nitrospiraceae bacterium]|nr:multidrug efflux SMR transporter [Nitrospiraceae bacterium]